MNYPKISIVTPNYNKVHFLESTILSVLSQNYPNLEYIIIDGGSTDGSVDIIKKYEDKLTYWISEPDNGMYFAIKKGFEHSTGEIMAWIGSDDMYHPLSLFTVAEIFTKYPSVSWLEGIHTHFDENNRTVRIYDGPYLNRIDFLMNNYRWIQQESTFWRRSLYEKSNGISTDYKLAGDFDLWIRFSRHEKMYYTNAPLGGFRHSSIQLTNDFDLYQKEILKIISLEAISDDEKKQIRSIRWKSMFINIIKKSKIFNWRGVYQILMKEKIVEENNHKITYDFITNSFILGSQKECHLSHHT